MRRLSSCAPVLVVALAAGACGGEPRPAARAALDPPAYVRLPVALSPARGAARWATVPRRGEACACGLSLLRAGREASVGASGARLVAIDDDGVPHVAVDPARASEEAARAMVRDADRVLALRVLAFAPRDAYLVAMASRECRVRFDASDHVYRVSRDAAGESAPATARDALVECVAVADLAVGDAAAWAGLDAREALFAVYVDSRSAALARPVTSAPAGGCAEPILVLGASPDVWTSCDGADDLRMPGTSEPACGTSLPPPE